MKYQFLRQLVPCIAAIFVALTAVESQGQEAQAPDSTEAYVGDLPAWQGCGCNTQCRFYGRSDLFYNYFTEGCSNQTNAQMYLSPMPVPPNVGHTYITYQPFYPHELMYSHINRSHNYYDNGRGLHRIGAIYYSPPIRQALSNLYWNYLRLPR